MCAIYIRDMSYVRCLTLTLFNQSVYKKGYLSDINQLLKNALYDGYAVSLVVDEYYVTNRIRYQNEHKRHQIMVYGYNATEELYDVLGYDTNYAYSHTTITPKQLEEAFYKYEIIDTNQDSIILMGMKSFEKPMSANMDLLCKELNEYITNTNTYCPEVALYSYTKKFYFGFNVYDIIREFVQKPDYKLENYPLFYMIYEHKRNFVFRMQYIMEEYGIDLTKQINAYNNIEKKSKYLLNLFLKYMVSNTPKKKNEEAAKIVKIIDEIIADEKSCLPELLEILSKMQYT